MSVAQNFRGFVERLLRAAQRVLGSRMWLSQEWLRTTDQDQRNCRYSGIGRVYTSASMATSKVVISPKHHCSKCYRRYWKLSLNLQQPYLRKRC